MNDILLYMSPWLHWTWCDMERAGEPIINQIIGVHPFTCHRLLVISNTILLLLYFMVVIHRLTRHCNIIFKLLFKGVTFFPDYALPSFLLLPLMSAILGLLTPSGNIDRFPRGSCTDLPISFPFGPSHLSDPLCRSWTGTHYLVFVCFSLVTFSSQSIRGSS